MTLSATKRRGRVLIKDPYIIARDLRAHPGLPEDREGWFLIGVGYPDENYSLEQVARILAQTAYRIRQNYRPNERGVRQGLKAFAADDSGYFEATSTADQRRANQIAPVELSARWVRRTE